MNVLLTFTGFHDPYAIGLVGQEEPYKLRWAQYTANPAFDLVDDLIIEGKQVSPSGKRS